MVAHRRKPEAGSRLCPLDSLSRSRHHLRIPEERCLMTSPFRPLIVATLFVVNSATVAGTMDSELKRETVVAFDGYVRVAEERIKSEVQQPERFLYLDTLGDAKRTTALSAVRRGEVVVEAFEMKDRGKAIGIPNGRVHHWVGVAFIQGARLEQAVKLLQDYDRHADVYKPAVQRSKILSRDGDRFRVFLRFYQKKGIAVTVNSEHEAEFFRAGPDRVHSRIHSTRIAEVEEPGTPGEKEKPVGLDGGYLWRLNTYWRFLQRDGGTYIQCESITLTRDIPFGFGWVVGPFVNSIPRESLAFTMERTRDALRGQ
jgi:hypothetical protein